PVGLTIYRRSATAGIPSTRLFRSHLQERRAEILEPLLAELPDTRREVFVLRDVQGLDVPEVAQRLGITPGNARVRANRARAQLREHLAALGWLDTEASA